MGRGRGLAAERRAGRISGTGRGGHAARPPPPGDLNADSTLDIGDANGLLFALFVADSTSPLPCGASLTDPGNAALLDSNGDGGVDTSDATRLLSYLFLSSPAPSLGTGCVPIAGCPDGCSP